MSIPAVEREMLFLGDEDDRVASALVRENDGLHNKQEIISRAEEAQQQGDSAA